MERSPLIVLRRDKTFIPAHGAGLCSSLLVMPDASCGPIGVLCGSASLDDCLVPILRPLLRPQVVFQRPLSLSRVSMFP